MMDGHGQGRQGNVGHGEATVKDKEQRKKKHGQWRPACGVEPDHSNGFVPVQLDELVPCTSPAPEGHGTWPSMTLFEKGQRKKKVDAEFPPQGSSGSSVAAAPFFFFFGTMLPVKEYWIRQASLPLSKT